MKKILFSILFICLIWYIFFYPDEVSLGPGVMAPDIPLQDKIAKPETHRVNDFTISPVATFSIKAKVLSRKDYHFGREADLSPVDLALGWGRMSDESVLDKIDISQSGRWYRWRVDAFPIPQREIETHSANMHLIPANTAVARAIDKVRNGDLVEFSGSLVNIAADDGWHWNSSRTRDDTGNGSCELIWVDSFKVVTL